MVEEEKSSDYMSTWGSTPEVKKKFEEEHEHEDEKEPLEDFAQDEDSELDSAGRDKEARSKSIPGPTYTTAAVEEEHKSDEES